MSGIPTIRIHIFNDDPAERDDWQKQLDELMPQWEEMTAKQREELYRQIDQAIRSGDYAQLSQLEVNTEDGTVLIEAAMVVMAGLAAARMVKAAKDAGKTIQPVNPRSDQVHTLATTTSKLMGTQLATAAAREAIRVSGPYTTADEVVSGVTGHLEGLSDAFPRDQLGGALWSAENIGRYVTLNAVPVDDQPTYYEASELRDKTRCEPCSTIDGTKFESLREAVLAYPNGGYHQCLGGIRCRGTFDPMWRKLTK